jgi:hypothetical protein
MNVFSIAIASISFLAGLPNGSFAGWPTSHLIESKVEFLRVERAKLQRGRIRRRPKDLADVINSAGKRILGPSGFCVGTARIVWERNPQCKTKNIMTYGGSRSTNLGKVQNRFYFPTPFG